MAKGNGSLGTRTSNCDPDSLLFENRAIQNAYESPLNVFAKAKKKLNDIFSEMEEYFQGATHFIHVLHAETEYVDKAEHELFEMYVREISTNREALVRDCMKIAFFGRTSCGKRSVINALLREEILPSGVEHATNCSCQIEAYDGQKTYLMKDGSDFVNVEQLTTALFEDKMNDGSLLRILCPRARCRLLCDDVVFVDIPCVDKTENLDDWFEKYCINADVFVLVLNVQSTMTTGEQQFCNIVTRKLSKPNIFIVNNGCIASAKETEMVKSQQIDFLARELKVCSKKEATQRIFFVSALETLRARLEEDRSNMPCIAGAAQALYFDFRYFEPYLKKCTSKSALKTKIQEHSSSGRRLSDQLYAMLDNFYKRTTVSHNQITQQKTLLTERLKCTETQLIEVTRDVKQRIQNMMEEVELKVSRALFEEIWSISELIDDFRMPFPAEPLFLNAYTQKLNSHLESALRSNLRARLSAGLSVNIEATQQKMTDRINTLVPNGTGVPQTSIATRTQPFEMLYALNCHNVCADFKEDLKFKFSWGITAMMQRFGDKVTHGNEKSRGIVNRQRKVENISPITTIKNEPMGLLPHPIGGITQQQFAGLTRFAVASIGARGTMEALIVAGILLKTTGWRVLLGFGAIYSCVYMYEWLSWTNFAKRRSFKLQYARHAAKKLKMIVDLTSANCGHQVQQELATTFAYLGRLVDNAITDMKVELESLEEQLTVLESYRKRLKLLRNKAKHIRNEFDLFEDNCIREN